MAQTKYAKQRDRTGVSYVMFALAGLLALAVAPASAAQSAYEAPTPLWDSVEIGGF